MERFSNVVEEISPHRRGSMKEQRLKKVLKPLIKECIKEIIFEDGVLSSIISESIRGASAAPPQPIVEQKKSPKRKAPNKQIADTKKQLLGAIGKGAYGDIDLFEGTSAFTEAEAAGSPKGDSMAGVDPNDTGIDISNIPGFGKWGSISEGAK